MSLPDVGDTSVKNGAKLLNLCSRILNESKVDKSFRNLVNCPVSRLLALVFYHHRLQPSCFVDHWEIYIKINVIFYYESHSRPHLIIESHAFSYCFVKLSFSIAFYCQPESLKILEWRKPYLNYMSRSRYKPFYPSLVQGVSEEYQLLSL